MAELTQEMTSPTYQAPAVPGEEYVPPPPAALHVPDGDAFNVDPTTPYLDSGLPANVNSESPSGSRRSDGSRFGGVASAVKRAIRRSGTSQSPTNPREPRPLSGARRQSYASPPPQSTSRSGYAQGSHGSPTSSARTMDTAGHDDEATAVEHEMLPVAQVMGSPVYVEPQPGSDYAKMDSPRRSISSFASYVSRVQKFFRELNELPWVAERVTVDYIPGQVKGRRQARDRRPQRATSWYGTAGLADARASRHTTNLFSDTTSPTSRRSEQLPVNPPMQPGSIPGTQYVTIPAAQQSSMPDHVLHTSGNDTLLYPANRDPTQPVVIFQIRTPDEFTRNLPYAHVVPASFSFSPPAPQPAHPVQATPLAPQRDPPTQQWQTPQPTTSTAGPTPAQSPSTAAFRPYGESYPMGYMSYQHQGAVADQYNNMVVHGLSQEPPRPQPSISGTAPQPSRPASHAASAHTGAPTPSALWFSPVPGFTPPNNDAHLRDSGANTQMNNSGTTRAESPYIPGSYTPYTPGAQTPGMGYTPAGSEFGGWPSQGGPSASNDASPHPAPATPRVPASMQYPYPVPA
ncbi:hypothetical protein H0H81_005901 [Sphagnurus paluster]|uniref:Uncharacterized protein n=1 Tax=Sphagnurus paluster TaxID=117069 RepID=A0A9P7K782_9AGAR|nr:hypothetical protein H0H81_005901 [Sphagnurus paluster]